MAALADKYIYSWELVSIQKQKQKLEKKKNPMHSRNINTLFFYSSIYK